QFRVFGKKHVLTYENGLINWVYFIKNGWVRRSKGTGALPYKTSLMMVDQDVGADFLGAGNCLGLEALGGEAKWSYTTTVLARTEVLELPLPQLRADPELAETLMRTFSAFSHADDDVRLEALRDERAVAAISSEIETGIVDATNLLVMDMDLCVRCGNCSMACHKIHGQSRLLRRGIHVERPVRP